jgi:hypothetical protein
MTMALTLPELDDRTYDDLTEEARSLLVTYAPALTNHNASDPLVTLTELFAYLTDVMLFRLNTVTDANRTAFLRLLNGPDWQAPTSSAGLDAEVRRSVNLLRSVDRAVTAADYESLALAADPAGRIARARCVPGFDLTLATAAARATPTPGKVSVVIVPAAGAPLAELIPVVVNYLEPRRLLATRVQVVGPRLVPLRVRVTVRLLPDAPVKAAESATQAMQARVRDALTRYFDPLIGNDGHGWPFGRSVNVSEMYRLLDTLPGVDFVVRSTDPSTQVPLDELITTAEFADRLVRNDDNELVSITLRPDELVMPQIVVTDIAVQPAVSLL